MIEKVLGDVLGVIIGVSNGQLLIDGDMNFVVVFGLCCSGKGMFIVVFMLLIWCESVIVIDVYGELYGIIEYWWCIGVYNQVCWFVFGDFSSLDIFNFLEVILCGMVGELVDIYVLVDFLLSDGLGSGEYWCYYV